MELRTEQLNHTQPYNTKTIKIKTTCMPGVKTEQITLNNLC